ncbi:cytochrome P450 [Leptolyngbya sp. 7M]|uniref:cytochrome P450 n=1 Tax=Leptolyngbya sp. 7M TaxID=2812896 RepID=UPI001B8C884F|nr:cytochrome P450 [Leptolyngbya sp. 7M]QYO62379.1 cytochrome P450 [Leptolyngbya sp. 7M]
MQNDLANPSFTISPSYGHNYPPVVRGWSFWNLLRWTFTPLEFLESCAKRYGDCFTMRFGSGESVCVSHPQAIAEIFTNPQLYDYGRAQVALKFTMGDFSLLTLDGEPHRRQRQLLMPPFHGERMKAYGDTICQIAEQVIHLWQPGQPLTILPAMQEITLQIMLKVVFGLNEGERYRQMRSNIRKLLSIGADPLSYMFTFFPVLLKEWGPWKPLAVYEALKRQVDDLLYAEIRERRANFDPNRTDILTLLLSARDEAGAGMTDQELRFDWTRLFILPGR